MYYYRSISIEAKKLSFAKAGRLCKVQFSTRTRNSKTYLDNQICCSAKMLTPCRLKDTSCWTWTGVYMMPSKISESA